jgi:hypothetical protein
MRPYLSYMVEGKENEEGESCLVVSKVTMVVSKRNKQMNDSLFAV